MEENRTANFSIGVIVVGICGLVLLALLWLLMGPVAFVNPGHRGVEVEQGRVTGKIYSEGWYIYNSITKDVVDFDTRTQIETTKADAASQDLQDVHTEIAVQYRLDANMFSDILKTIGRQKDVKEKIIDPAVQETVKASTALFPVAEIIKQRPLVKKTIEELLKQRIAGYGVVLEELSIKDITFSGEFTKAIEQKQVAEQGKAQAEFEAQSRIAQAEGKAQEQKLLVESLTPLVLQRLWIERWNGVVPGVVSGSGSDLIFNLPGK